MSIIYKSIRIGKNGKTFYLYKLRTMVENADKIGGLSTSADDPRLTKIGNWLRKYKIDEIPQIWNIIKGDIAIVGPRPEVPIEVYSLSDPIRKILLSVKPGLISPATLWDFHEEETLRGSKDPHKTYCEEIKPLKMKMNIEYVLNKSFWGDIKILWEGILKLLRIK